MGFLQVLKCFICFPLNQIKLLVISSSLKDYHKIQVKQLLCWLFFLLKGKIQSGYKLLLARSLMLNRFHSSSFLVFIFSSGVEKGKHMLGFYVCLVILNYQTLGLGFLVKGSVLVLGNLYEIGVSILCLK